MNIKLSNAKLPVSYQQLAEVEHFVGFELPQPYKNFLLASNGGLPEPDGFKINWQNQEMTESYPESMIESFLAVHDGKYANLMTHYKRFKGRIPEDTIAVGYDPGGNLILLGLGQKNSGVVYYWASDYESDDADYTNVGFVASNFDEFLNSLFKIEAH